jgi:putative hydrolase of the HAD superfamily
MARAALFDAGDTLVHWNVHKRDRFTWLCQQVGIALPDDDTLRTNAARAAERFFYSQLAREDSWSEAWWLDQSAAGLAELGLGRDLAAQIASFRMALPNRFVLDPEAIPTLEALKSRDYKIGLVSNWDGSLEVTCRELGLDRYVDYIGDSSVFGQVKPSAEFFLHVLEQLGVSPEQAFHVGDHYDADVEGARAAGITPILMDIFDYEDRFCALRARSLPDVIRLVDEIWPNGG